MNFKIISSENFSKLFPNLKVNDEFVKLYSCYFSLLEKYLLDVMFLGDLNKKIVDNNLGIDFNNLYKEISNLNLDYIVLLNKVNLNKLSKEELQRFQSLFYLKDIEKLSEFVVSTFRNLIDNDGKIVIGVSIKDDKNINLFLTNKVNDYLDVVGVPVVINRLNENNDKIISECSKFLPIGSVVLIKEASKKVMIVGYTMVNLEKKNCIYDYLGCFYPEGIVDRKINIAFNHEDIKDVFYLGFQNSDSQEFISNLNNGFSDKNKLNELLENI